MPWYAILVLSFLWWMFGLICGYAIHKNESLEQLVRRERQAATARFVRDEMKRVSSEANKPYTDKPAKPTPSKEN
jgi:hypothetical protein